MSEDSGAGAPIPPEEEDGDEESILCPHGYDASNECPVCDISYSFISEDDEEKCQILLDHASLAGNYRNSLERLLEGVGSDSDETKMRDLFQMHISIIHAHQK